MNSAERLTLYVSDEDRAASNESAQFIVDAARQTEGVVEATRVKGDTTSMDTGSIVQIVLSSGAMVTIARGLVAWLKARRGASLVIETGAGAESIRTIVKGIDPATAERIVERHVGG